MVLRRPDYGQVTCTICGKTVDKTNKNQNATCGGEHCKMTYRNSIRKKANKRRIG